MIKKILLLLGIAPLFCTMQAQNLQIHYDLGNALYKDLNSRQSITTTFDMFKPDRWGNTYTFIDLDYKSDGVMGAYFEIEREINLSKNKQWAFHIEYNGGLTTGKLEQSYYANRFQHALLVGAAWNWHNADFSKTFSLKGMYQHSFKQKHTGMKGWDGYHVTTVWGIQFAQNRFTFNGFYDFWYNPNTKRNFQMLGEPQFWYNLDAYKKLKDVHLSIGTEVEISKNFVWNNKGENDKFYAIPTLALKWTFQ